MHIHQKLGGIALIFYFTATGNSLFIAEKISKITGEELKNIADVMNDQSTKFIENTKISIICPVHFYGLPLIVEDFIKKIDPKTSEISYIVLNYGTFPGQAMARAEHILQKRSLKVQSKMTVKMPENYILLFNSPVKGECERIISEATDKIEIFAEAIKENKCIDLCETPSVMQRTFGKLARPIYDHGRGTGRFYVNTDCIKCGKCAEMCPCKAIKMIDRIPTWTENKCLRCCACINRCPRKAIEFGLLTKNKRRYVNPNVTFTEHNSE